MPPALEKLTPSEVELLHTNFNKYHPILTCPQCHRAGHIKNNGLTRSEPKMPTFRCSQCDQYINHMQIQERIQATTPTMLGAVPNPVFLPTHATSYQSSNQQPADILQTVLQQIADHSKRLDDHDQQVNAQLSAQLNTQQEPLSSFGSQIDFDQLDSQAPKPISATSTNNNSRLPSTNPWTNSTYINNTIKQTTTKKYNLKRQARKEQAAIRFFQPPSANQGFQYLYFNTKTRMPIGQVRHHLCSININNGRILDIYYPEKNILALLIHNDFTDELKSQLGQHGITPKTSYDPTSPDILHDKKYQDMTTQDRTDIAFRLHVERMERAVRNIRYPVSLTVAHAFLEHGWISKETIAELAPNNKNKNSSIGSLFEDDDSMQDRESDNDL
ncbi:hypothetical protein BDC45DRAFT_452844 [Circinella umbellata]|nr:hypothetical protein BDC45DRAFT_452844 [Circinella umbellata]